MKTTTQPLTKIQPPPTPEIIATESSEVKETSNNSPRSSTVNDATKDSGHIIVGARSSSDTSSEKSKPTSMKESSPKQNEDDEDSLYNEELLEKSP